MIGCFIPGWTKLESQLC